MARLALSLLGPFQVTLDGEPVMGFESNKVRALLAYLAVEAHRSHRREVLAGLLWPEWPHRAALRNLRYALYNLRDAIGDRQTQPPFLLITRETIQFNTASDHWLDVTAFIDLTGLRDLSGLEKAIALYRGSFLEGFSISDSPAFEEWALFKREQIGRQVLSALHRLAAYYEQRGEYEEAQSYAWRQLELEPWDEEAHQQLMRALALSGRRSAALAQYETCRRVLAEELGVEPAAQTTRLYEQIRDGKFGRGSIAVPPAQAAAPVAFPSFLSSAPPHPGTLPPFIAREPELERLNGFLERALVGHGQMVFVTGGAGRGKTALIQEFSRRAQEAHPDLIVAGGHCNAHTGIGDPYLPFREALGLLTGDLEGRWAAGAITREHACRLWKALPLTVQALVEDGPDLIDTFVPGAALVARAAAWAPGKEPWLDRLQELVERKALRPLDGLGTAQAQDAAANPEETNLQQSDLFEQYTNVLQAVARHAPLLLVVDDLQWADLGSISLLFHLGRRLAGSRILIVGAYRPEEVASGRGGPSTGSGRWERHPLEPVVNEFRCAFGDVTIELSLAEDREFVEEFLDSEPNRLGAGFRETLYQRTRGHPLYTVELLRAMQERGDLVQDEEGRWVEGPALDWETLPARVEAAIGERIGRLPEALQDALTIASVEGEEFTAEVVARVQEVSEGEMVRRLSGELEKRHRLVGAQRILRVGGQRLSRYRFRHYLFQKYLENSLDEVERAHLHERVGNLLETLYGERAAEIAVQLARHFEAAGLVGKAVHYRHLAGSDAVRLSANQEAIAHFRDGLTLLETLPDTPERARQELTLQIALGVPLTATKGWGAPEVGHIYARARELCQQLGEVRQLVVSLLGLWRFNVVQAELQTAHELAQQLLALAQEAQDLALLVLAHRSLGTTLWYLGKLAPARAYLEQCIAFYNSQQHRALAFHYDVVDQGVACRCFAVCVLWCLGYSEQALERSREALALAQEVAHPFSLAWALGFAAIVHQCRREGPAVQEQAEACIRLSTEQGFAFMLAWGMIMRGWALAERGEGEARVREIRQGLAALRATGSVHWHPYVLACMAEAHGKVRQVEEGLAVLAEALALIHRTGARYWEAEVYRLEGELLQMRGASEAERFDSAGDEVEACFRRAIEVARRQQAKSLELRATVSLCRLLQGRGKREEAHQMLAEIYDWFTEGFDTPDLRDAEALLKELA